MSLFRRRKLLRRFFHALEKVAGNLGLIREAGKEMRTFSHEEVTLVRQLSESRQRMLDLQAMRAEQQRQASSAAARAVLEAIDDVERRQQALLARQSVLLRLCRQLLARTGGAAGGEGTQQAAFLASPAAGVTEQPLHNDHRPEDHLTPGWKHASSAAPQMFQHHQVVRTVAVPSAPKDNG